jgi:two-component system, chemotaxis family, sensor kinase CheA
MSEPTISSELIGIYVEDARAHLEALDHCLLTLERDGLDAEAIAAVLGPLHTLKGNSGMIGFSSIKDYVHRLEDAFARISESTLPLDPDVFDVLFSGASALREAIEQACQTGQETRPLDATTATLAALIAGATAPPAPAVKPAPSPAASPSSPLAPSPTPRAVVATTDPAGKKAAESQQYVVARSNLLRVEFSKLDQLLNLVGELIIYRTKLQQVGKRLAETLETHGAAQELLSAVAQVAGVSAQLQEMVMQIRMLPVRQVFERFPRMVRDLARQQGKDIELIVEGESTRVDKAIIDEIGEPLVHMLRNSVDHGIEPPDVRLARGKTPTGTILLSAAQESNHVLITIMDDGAGVDAAAVRRRAIERGLIKPDQPLTEREAVQLIFAPGFSTAEKVTEVSGRGVGLDVVLKAIEHLNGLVEVESVPGVGTKFIIQLPLTLAIISTLLVDVAGGLYAIPLSTVVESLRFATSDVQRIKGRSTLRLRDRIVPLARLADIFGLPSQKQREREYAVIVGRGDKQLGLVVDGLAGQQEVVIKALDAVATTAHSAVAGATIMGDGRVVLIVDVPALFEGGRRTTYVHEHAEAASLP